MEKENIEKDEASIDESTLNATESSNLNSYENKEEVDMKTSFKKKLRKKDEEIEKLNSEVNKWKNDYYRVYADMANLRKDIQKDHSEIIKYRIEGFANELLTVLDAFEIALKNEPENEETRNYLKGFEYVYSNLLKILENEGLKVITPKIGDKFDSNLMHAVEKVECDDEENIVKEVMLKGYKLYDHLIRASMVKVSVHPSVKEEDEDNKEETKDEE